MRNFNRMNAGTRNQVQGCFGQPCTLCNKPAVAAVGSWDRYRPACDRHARIAQANGYTVVWQKMEAEQ